MIRLLVSSFAALAMLTGCSSSPKVSKNPAEAAEMQKQAETAIAAGQTESAKKGGYDHLEFWKNPSEFGESMLSQDLKTSVFSESKKVVLLDFKVIFKNHYYGIVGGSGFLSSLMDRANNPAPGLGTGVKTVSVREQLTVFANVVPPTEMYQAITDKMYDDFCARLKKAGFEVVTRDQVQHEELQKHLASDKMVASPFNGKGYVAYAPRGWKLEEATIEPSLSGAFGTTLNDVGGRISRKQEVIFMSPNFTVDLGTMKKSEGGMFVPMVSVTGAANYGYEYTVGMLGTKPVADGITWKYDAAYDEAASNSGSTGKAIAIAGAMMTGKSMDYSASKAYKVTPVDDSLKNRILEHFGYAEDIVFQAIRTGRDD